MSPVELEVKRLPTALKRKMAHLVLSGWTIRPVTFYQYDPAGRAWTAQHAVHTPLYNLSHSLEFLINHLDEEMCI